MKVEKNLTILNKVLKEGNTEKMVFEQGHNGDGGGRNVATREKAFQA